MGLPEPATKPVAAEPSVEPARGVPAARPANPWESAGATLREQQQTPAPDPAPASAAHPPAAPWVPQDERSGAAFARRFGRGLIWFVLILAAVTGVRAWFVPPKAEAPKVEIPKAAPAYPAAEAQSAAGRFARAYLTWDEARAEEREALLASVLSDGTDPAMGWDGQGRQDVTAVQPGAVTPTTRGQARVRVDVLVRPAAPPAVKGKPAPPAPPARWIGLDVPVVSTERGVVVTGRPGLVGIPVTGPKAPDLPTTKTDPELSAATKSTVETFFKAYAGGDGTDAVTAPGAVIPALAAGVEYRGLVSWSADAGSGSDRTGTALVSWSLGGATLETAYRVTLTRVTSTDAHRWQVAEVRGGSV
ncbi:conjugal transfer protein [Streptomyces tsukubensis]|uniref:conjugal transfer protein n=1 Tax=Streptomyces tsukubensis TaxID=83656 RepID=UPI00344FEC88